MRACMYTFAYCILILICVNVFIHSNNVSIKQPPYTFDVDTLAKDLIVPWAIVFLPDKTMLFNERAGRVRIYRNNQLILKPALIFKEADTTKKMGLLGLVIHPEFNNNKYIYLSYNYREENKALLRVVRYRFQNDTLIQPTIIIDNISASPNHTGCRLKFGQDGKIYITTGDADIPKLAQDLKSLNGKILRVNYDGSIPPDNPFVKNDTVRKEVWSFGHRNTQGIAFQPGTGYLFNSEHGPNGGDEVNIINKGLNYGWPVIHHDDTMPGMISPLLEYTPSIGPSEALFYNGEAFPLMKGNLLIACLRGESILRIQLDKEKIISQEILFKQQYGRIRALAIGPDGYIYFSTSQNDPPEGRPRPGYDMILRIRPSLNNNNNSQYSNTVKINTSKKKLAEENIPADNRANNLYQQLCAGCHGKDMKGTDKAKSFVDGKWEYGSSRKEIIKNIREGIIDKGMPAWEGAISNGDIEKITDFILVKHQKNK